MQRHLRLRGRKNFDLLRTDGQAIRHSLLILSYRDNGMVHNRYGMIVSRRLGHAVARNKIRRRLREALRQYDAVITGGFDIVLIARQAINNATYHEIIDALQSALEKAGLLMT